MVWNKGCALEYFLDNLGFENSNDVLPIYIGDDQTDEDAFEVNYIKLHLLFCIKLFKFLCVIFSEIKFTYLKILQVLRKRGKGFPIIVTATPENTKALYSLREPKDVMEFLLRLLAA